MLAKNLRQKLRQHKRVSWPHSQLASEQIMVPQRQTYVSRTEQVDTVADRVVDTTVDRLSILSHSEILQDLFIVKTYFESCTAGHISGLRDRVTRAVFASLGSPDAFSQSPPVLHNALRLGLPKKVGSA